jgi:hypothetical protein
MNKWWFDSDKINDIRIKKNKNGIKSTKNHYFSTP